VGRPRKQPKEADTLVRAATIAELKRRLDEEFERAILDARRSGASYAAIGQRVDMHPEAVRRLLMKFGDDEHPLGAHVDANN
jgi:transposase-like protein